jgi:hypothetical protein
MSWSDDGNDAGAMDAVADQGFEEITAEQEVVMPEVKLFNKWSLADVEVSDISLSVS